MEAVIDKAAAVVLRDGKLLMCRSRGRQVFFLPGGKRQPGESDVQCLARELDEELGCAISGAAQHLRTFSAPSHGGGTLRLACWQVQLDGRPRPRSEVEELVWAGADCPADLLTVSTREQVLPRLAGRGLVR